MFITTTRPSKPTCKLCHEEITCRDHYESGHVFYKGIEYHLKCLLVLLDAPKELQEAVASKAKT